MRRGDLIREYEFVKRLGRGASGEVWEGKKGGESYAIKCLPSSDATAGMEETFAQRGGLNSPFLVKYYESFREIVDGDESLFIVMELCKGGELSKSLALMKEKTNQEHGLVIGMPRLMRIFIELLLGIRKLHTIKLLHRDLCPFNIFVDGDFNIKIGDFGWAQYIATRGYASKFVGHPAYLSPEVYDGKYAEGSDLWSVGVVMYELASGELPWTTTNEMQYYNVIVNTPIKPLSKTLGFRQDFTDTIHAILVKNPLQRATVDSVLCSPLVQEYAAQLDYGSGVKLLHFFPPEIWLDQKKCPKCHNEMIFADKEENSGQKSCRKCQRQLTFDVLLGRYIAKHIKEDKDGILRVDPKAQYFIIPIFQPKKAGMITDEELKEITDIIEEKGKGEYKTKSGFEFIGIIELGEAALKCTTCNDYYCQKGHHLDN